MALNLISNFAANVAQRNLSRTDNQLTSSLSKLSSGTRVVSARDDAASLAIGSSLRAETNALKQASVNAGQAGSFLQIADGALATISDILVRQKALAVQAASGQLGQTERTVLDSEFQALTSEITRISTDTEFNGTQLIAGNAVNSTVSSSSLSALGIQKVDFSAATQTTTGNTFRITFDSTSNILTLNFNSGDATASALGTQSIDLTNQVAAIGALTGNETLDVTFGGGITLTLNSSFNTGADIGATVTDNVTTANTDITALDITTTAPTFGNTATQAVVDSLTSLTALDGNGAGFNSTTGVLRIAVEANGTADQIDLKGIAGVSFNAEAAGADSLALTSGDTVDVKVGGVTLGTITFDTITANATANQNGFIDFNAGQGFIYNNFSANTGDSTFTFKVGTGTNTAADDLSFTLKSANATALGINGDAVTSAALANTASTNVSAAIDAVNSRR